ncbi:MAG: M48 family peptidase [Caldilineae bacterium]|nr:MAG: M48 family peptidase [Caldilineae bacterium]
MSTERHFIEVSGIQVEVVRKSIKNLHLGVYPPEGRVRVATPLSMDDEAVRLAVVSRLGWIRRKQQEFREQARQSEREMVTGETHYVWGQRYRLEVIEQWWRQHVELGPGKKLRLCIHPGADRERRLRVLNRWYREELRKRIPKLIRKWEPKLGVKVSDWRVKRMRTRWGTCNPEAGRIWINLELAKKPPQCLEYIVVHEMAHLIERTHNYRFQRTLDQAMPRWKIYRELLQREPLAHEEWIY